VSIGQTPTINTGVSHGPADGGSRGRRQREWRPPGGSGRTTGSGHTSTAALEEDRRR